MERYSASINENCSVWKGRGHDDRKGGWVEVVGMEEGNCEIRGSRRGIQYQSIKQESQRWIERSWRVGGGRLIVLDVEGGVLRLL